MTNNQPPTTEEELRDKIKRIIHGDTPDHFMSDNMLGKPDEIMQLIRHDREQAVVKAQIETAKRFKGYMISTSPFIRQILGPYIDEKEAYLAELTKDKEQS
jgi:hypothetical protein